MGAPRDFKIVWTAHDGHVTENRPQVSEFSIEEWMDIDLEGDDVRQELAWRLEELVQAEFERRVCWRLLDDVDGILDHLLQRLREETVDE